MIRGGLPLGRPWRSGIRSWRMLEWMFDSARLLSWFSQSQMIPSVG